MTTNLLIILAQGLFIQLYWLSLLVIGYVLLKRISKRLKLESLLHDSIFFTVILSFAMAVFALGIPAVVFYLFKLPAITFTVLYIVLLCYACVVALTKLRYQSPKKLIARLRGYPILMVGVAILLTLLLGLDYLYSLYVGNQFAEGSDAYVHVAKIVGLLQGFTFEDGFLAGLVDTRYLLNIIYPLYIPPAQLLPGVEAAQVWLYSLAFFRMLQWVAIGALAFHVLVKWLGMSERQTYPLTAVAIALAMSLFAGWNVFMHVATYPNKVVTLWFLILLVGYAYVQKGRIRQPLFLIALSAILITLTHPTYALMAAMFICFYGLVVVSLNRRSWFGRGNFKKLTAVFLLPPAILLISPLITLTLPDRMTDKSFNYGNFATVDIAGVSILKPQIPTGLLGFTLTAVVVLGYLWLLRTLWKRKEKTRFALVLCLLLFYPLVAYNPIFMGVTHDVLPVWLVARFSAINLLGYLSIFFGLIALCKLIRCVEWKTPRRLLFVTVALLIVVVFVRAANTSYQNLYKGTKDIDHGYASFLERTHKDLQGVIPAGSMVVANLGDSYLLPAAIPVKVVGIYESHATPAAAASKRLACQQQLLQSLNPADLYIVGAEYVVIPPWDSRFNKLQSILSSRDYFSFVMKGSDFWVYEVDRSKLPKPHANSIDGPCVQYREIETNGQ